MPHAAKNKLLKSDVCVVKGCDELATRMNMCRNCRNNYLYHINKGAVHLAVWGVKVRMKVNRLKLMEEDIA